MPTSVATPLVHSSEYLKTSGLCSDTCVIKGLRGAGLEFRLHCICVCYLLYVFCATCEQVHCLLLTKRTRVILQARAFQGFRMGRDWCTW